MLWWIGSGKPDRSARGRDWPAAGGWILEKLLKEETVIALPSVVVSRQLLEQLGAFDEELVMCEDDELWFRLAAHSEIDGVDEPLTLIRRHGQHSGSDIMAWQDRRRVFEKALRASRGGHLDSMLRRLRAEMSAGLAKSQAASGKRIVPSVPSSRARRTPGDTRSAGSAHWSATARAFAAAVRSDARAPLSARSVR